MGLPWLTAVLGTALEADNEATHLSILFDWGSLTTAPDSEVA